MAQTKLENLVNPEVMADMISAELPARIKFSKIAKIDKTLVDKPGNTITVPKYEYIGDAEDVAEGVAMGTTVLTASTTQATVKKAGKAVEITDESAESAYGNPVGEAKTQLVKAISAKVDNDCYAALITSKLIYDGSAGIIDYAGVTKAVGILEDEEDNTEKLLFIHPSQETQLRLDPLFQDKNVYPMDVIMNGTIGKIAGCQVVPSKKIKDVDGVYLNVIVVVDVHDPNEDSAADGEDAAATALTIYLKKDVEVEADRDILAKTTVISADEHYTAVLSNESKVVVAKFKKEA